MPTQVALLMVVNLQKDRYRPSEKGTIKPMTKAQNVGSTNKGHHFFVALIKCISSLSISNTGSQPTEMLSAHFRYYEKRVGSGPPSY